MNASKLAQARRLYHHVLHGGTLRPNDVSFMVEALEEAERQTVESVEALKEAVYLLHPTDEDMQKKEGVYRIVTALEKAEKQREWVGLTDEEIGTLTVFDGLHHVETPLLAGLIRVIEAKLKEKNT